MPNFESGGIPTPAPGEPKVPQEPTPLAPAEELNNLRERIESIAKRMRELDFGTPEWEETQQEFMRLSEEEEKLKSLQPQGEARKETKKKGKERKKKRGEKNGGTKKDDRIKGFGALKGNLEESGALEEMKAKEGERRKKEESEEMASDTEEMFSKAEAKEAEEVAQGIGKMFADAEAEEEAVADAKKTPREPGSESEIETSTQQPEAETPANLPTEPEDLQSKSGPEKPSEGAPRSYRIEINLLRNRLKEKGGLKEFGEKTLETIAQYADAFSDGIRSKTAEILSFFKRKKKEQPQNLTPEEILTDRGWSEWELAEMSPAQKQEALLFESAWEYNDTKKKHDPIRRFTQESMGIDPDPEYRTFDTKSYQEDEQGGVKANLLIFNNYHNYLQYRTSLSEEDKVKIDREWKKEGDRLILYPALFASNDFLKALNEEGEEFKKEFNKLREEVIAGEIEDTFEQELERRRQEQGITAGEKSPESSSVEATEKQDAPVGEEYADKPEAEPKESEVKKKAELSETKVWEDLTEDERKERMERRADLKEKLIQFKLARTNLAVLEEQLNKKKSLLGRATGLISKESVEDLEQKYEAARVVYEEMRAEYIGAKTWRMLKERQRMAEADAAVHQEGAFEKTRELWRWLGDQNLEKVLGKKAPQSRLGRFLAKSISLRTGASFALLGTGMVLGAGSAVGISAIALRRVFAGTSTGLGVSDLLRNKYLQKNLESIEVDAKNLENLDIIELEEMMASLEVQAKFSGERIVHKEIYQKLKLEYKKRLEYSTDREKEIKDALVELDGLLRDEKSALAKNERFAKGVGVGVGLFIGSGAFAKLLGKIISFGAPADTTEGEVRGVIKNNPLLPADTVEEAIANDSILPEEVLDRAERPTARLDIVERSTTGSDAPEVRADFDEQMRRLGIVPEPESTPSPTTPQPGPTETGESAPSPTEDQPGQRPGGEGTGGEDAGDVDRREEPDAGGSEEGGEQEQSTRVNLARGVSEQIEIEIPSKNIGAVRAGEGVWQITRALVESGAISQEEWAAAYSNPLSTYTLESGQTVHLSDMHLVRPGDQIAYVPATSDTPAHFRFVNSDNLHVGTKEDLAAAFDAAGRERPQWLQRALEASQEQGGPTTPRSGVNLEEIEISRRQIEGQFEPLARPEDIQIPQEIAEEVALPEEVTEQAAKGQLSTEGLKETFQWGTGEIIYDGQGRIAGIELKETLSPQERARWVQDAGKVILRPDFVQILESGVREDRMHLVVPERIARANESAFKIFQLMNMYNEVEKNSSEYYYLRLQIKTLLNGFSLEKNRVIDPKVFHPDIVKSF